MYFQKEVHVKAHEFVLSDYTKRKRRYIMLRKKTNDSNKVKKTNQDTVMSKSREMIPIMRQSGDPLGSYTGTSAEEFDKKPVQDADDL
jgi:hypothetical protein